MKAALLCLLLGGSAIGYVYQKNQIIDLGKQTQQRERKLAKLQEGNLKLEKTLMTLKTGIALEDRVKKLNLGLVQPLQSQILTIMEMPARTATRGEPLYAGTSAGNALQSGGDPALRQNAGAPALWK